MSTEVISDEELENVPPSTPPNIPPAQKRALHPPTANTHIYTNQSLPAYSYHTYQSRHTTYTNHTPASLPPATNAYMHTSNQYSPPTTVSPTQLHSHSSIHTPLTPLQTKHIPTSTPFRKKHTFMSLLEDDSMQDDVPYDILSMTLSTSRDSSLSHGPGDTSDWSSFASHFTAEFESLKAEVDTLRTEVKSLRKTIKVFRKFYKNNYFKINSVDNKVSVLYTNLLISLVSQITKQGCPKALKQSPTQGKLSWSNTPHSLQYMYMWSCCLLVIFIFKLWSSQTCSC